MAQNGISIKSYWKDYIKDYDGGTLMEAEIDPKIDYSNLSEILKIAHKYFTIRFIFIFK